MGPAPAAAAVAAALALALAACASGVDLARRERGDSPCARAAEKLCRERLPGADPQACIKREIAACELREESAVEPQ